MSDNSNTHRREPFLSKGVVSILLALFLQVGAGIWAMSSFYTEQTSLTKSLDVRFDGLDRNINLLEDKIYTRNEAALQFQLISENDKRHDQEIRDLEAEIRRLLIRESE